MSFEQTASEKQPKKDNRNLIYGILVAALLGTWGYIIYDKSKSSEKIEQLQTQYINVNNNRNEVQQLYNASLQRLDSLTGTNQELSEKLQAEEGEAGERSREIVKLKAEINAIFKKDKITATELATAKRKISELNNTINSYATEIEQLKGENQQLVAKNEMITTEKQAVEKNLAETQTEKKQLEEAVDVGSTLHASGINIIPINEKNGGKEKETTTAKRVDKLRIVFKVDENRIAATSVKELYVCMFGPDGKAISIPAYGSGTFNTRNEGSKIFTNKVSIPYEKGKSAAVSFDWRQDQAFIAGDYKIEVYHNGFKIGERIVNLKKGGLFS